MTVLGKKLARVSLLYCLVILGGLTELQGEGLIAQQKPYAAAIFIDHGDEIDIEKCYSITINFSVLMYLQTCPILVMGPHVLLNTIKRIDLLKRRSDAYLKYCIIFKKQLKDFDKNWLVFQMSEKFANYLIVPRKFIEHFFNIKFGDLKTSMSERLISLCNQAKVVGPSGKYCKNLSDVLMECGFDVLNASGMKQLFYADILNVSDESVRFKNRKSFEKEVASFLPNILRAADEKSKWQLLLDGHGISKTAGAYQPSMCGISEDKFNTVFYDICMKNVAWVCLISCFLGGPNRKSISVLAKRLDEHKRCPNIALFSSSDTPCYSFYPCEIVYQELCDYAKHLNVMLCEFNESATSVALMAPGILDSQFFSGKNVKKSIINVALSYLDKPMNSVLNLSNWPLVLEPTNGFNFLPLIDDELVCCPFSLKNKSVDDLKTNGQQILFLDNFSIESIQFNKKIPLVISVYPDPSVHLIKKIDAHNFDPDIKAFFMKFFMNRSVTIGCSKEFLIKELVLGGELKKYFNIYANLFYDKESTFFVTDIAWQDFQGKVFFCSYQHNDSDGSLKDTTKREWVERDFYELSKKDIMTFKKKFEETKLLVVGGGHV